MVSARLGDDLERRLAEAARVLGVSESEIVRQAVSARCEEILADRLDVRLRDFVGAASLGGGLSDDTGRHFTEVVERKHGR